MSEFSESYHLKTSETRHGIELLHRAGLRGFVFPATNGWVTVLPEGEPFVPNEPLIKASTGTLLYFGNAEDHGWWFAVYVDANPLVSYTCTWEDSIQVQQPLDIETFEEVIGPVLTSLGSEKVRQIFEPKDFEELFEVKPAYLLADAVGLKNYQWISFDYLKTDRAHGESNFDGVIFVE